MGLNKNQAIRLPQDAWAVPGVSVFWIKYMIHFWITSPAQVANNRMQVDVRERFGG